ncbi:MAG: acetate kinase [Clostridia bacterium]
MKILIINCGSSTIKFQLIDMNNENVIAKGRCDKIGYEDSNIIYKNIRDSKSLNEVLVSMPDHKIAMNVLLSNLMSAEHGVISSLDEIGAVGHRVVAGGEKFDKAVIVTNEVINDILELSEIAPLHNPGAVMGIKAIMNVAPNLRNVVVFDTAFHQTIPDYNYLYAIDTKYYDENHIRRYGAHGTSYMYIIKRLASLIKKDVKKLNVIVCHVGSGASVCAIKNGVSYDTSMGYTPLEGLVMETRCGDIDPAIILKIMKLENFTIEQMDTFMNKKSGRLGFAKIGDFRLMRDAANAGDKKAILMRKIQAQRTKKYIGAYMAELNRVDAIVFTGGIMENNADEIEMVISNMDYLGIKLDKKRNLEHEKNEGLISTDDSKVALYIIPTNEELEIAKQTKDVISNC